MRAGPRPRRPTSPGRRPGRATTRSGTLRLAVGQLDERGQAAVGRRENAQVERGIAVIQKARKELYQILAED